jgi:hypothetical protein
MAIIGLGMWWFYYCKSQPKYNGLLWAHPDKGGGVIDITKVPQTLQKPYYFNYRALEFGISYFRQPLYLWYQEKIVKDGITSYPIMMWEPKEPADFGLQATAKGEPDKSKPYITPNQLFATTDWSALRILETAKSSITETIKLGVAVLMACACIFGIIIALDMVGKKDETKPIQTAKPITQIIQPQNYGGLTIW